jgi:hypothetical protein
LTPRWLWSSCPSAMPRSDLTRDRASCHGSESDHRPATARRGTTLAANDGARCSPRCVRPGAHSRRSRPAPLADECPPSPSR